MSFLRHLLYHGRVFLNLGRGYPTPYARVFKVQPNFGGGRNQVRFNSFVPTRVAPSPNPGGTPVSTWQRIGQRIHSQIRRLLLMNVFRHDATSREMRRRAFQQLLYGNNKPFLALVGLSLASRGAVDEEHEQDYHCLRIKESFSRLMNKSNEVVTSESHQVTISDFSFGPLLAQGCNGVVYSAKWKDSISETRQSTTEQAFEVQQQADQTDEKWPLAIKMMFNYNVVSNSFAILKGMSREVVPAMQINLSGFNEMESEVIENIKRCPPHPSIVEISHVFADQVQDLPGGTQFYPSALPQRLHDEGLGRNMTLFLVMKRYDYNLLEYLRSRPELPLKTRLLILTQLLEGVAHLKNNGIAHRDLKTDNILVDLSQGEKYPRVSITDFGCCLADKTNGLNLPFPTYDTDRGGNSALMAPEIACAQPSSWKRLSFEKSDSWSIGAIAFEVFGEPNPFYKNSSNESHLDSRTYDDNNLPILPRDTPIFVQALVSCLLRRNPEERLSAEKAATICQIHLFAPTLWLLGSRRPSEPEVMQWLESLAAKVLSHNENQDLEYSLVRTFLARLQFSIVNTCIDWLRLRVLVN